MEITIWEYMIVSLRADGTYEAPLEGQDSGHLNDLAALGWEVDKVLRWEGVSGFVLLRRPLPLAEGE
jgi:hypothetical protein